MVQGEIPPQPEMRIGGVRGFVPYAATASLLASAMGGPPGNEVCPSPRWSLSEFSHSVRVSAQSQDIASQLKQSQSAPSFIIPRQQLDMCGSITGA